MRDGFFPEVVDDFKFLCELVKGEQRSAVLILDKNHAHTKFNANPSKGAVGLQSGKYGGTRTIEDLRKA